MLKSYYTSFNTVRPQCSQCMMLNADVYLGEGGLVKCRHLRTGGEKPFIFLSFYTLGTFKLFIHHKIKASQTVLLLQHRKSWGRVFIPTALLGLGDIHLWCSQENRDFWPSPELETPSPYGRPHVVDMKYTIFLEQLVQWPSGHTEIWL